MTTNYNTYEIPKDGYAAFDATSLRQLIISRLNEQGTFTDQNYVGSNLAAIIDIIAYAYNTLIFYLNKTSSESLFTEAQLYENVNRIVKLIDYSPVGSQTSTLTFNCSADTFSQGLYTLPRYSYIVLTGNIPFSFNEDITFNKTENTIREFVREVSEQKLLYQGIYQEYPTYTAAGEDYETIILNPGENNIVDHFNIDVYVKPLLTNKWEQFSKTPNLYLEEASSKKYEIRLNQNQRYEIKFGSGINGYKLQSGDLVGIYYLQSAGNDGIVEAGATNVEAGAFTTPQIYNTIQYNEIITDTLQDQYQFVTSEQSSFIKISNNQGSTEYTPPETVQQIRENAPITYRSQYRLVTAKDYEAFLKSNFANFISDIKAFSNSEYIFNYLQYFYNIGITEPEKTTRALINQIQFADSCNFNNVYLIVVPRSSATLNYLLPVQKELIKTSIQDSKVLTSETVFVDPVYMAVDLGVTDSVTTFDPVVEAPSVNLTVIKQQSSRRSDTAIKQDIINIITNYFSQTNVSMGQTVKTQELTQSILNIDSVVNVYTTSSDNPNTYAKGVSLFCWNPIYSTNDKTVTVNNIPLLPFQYPYFNNPETLSNRIVVTTSNIFEK